jgi:hypothetical protein
MVANANNLARFQNHLLFFALVTATRFDSLSRLNSKFFYFFRLNRNARREQSKKVSNTNMILEASALTKKKVSSIRGLEFQDHVLCRVFFFLRHHLSLALNLTESLLLFVHKNKIQSGKNFLLLFIEI